MEEISKIRAQKQVNNALNQRNGPSVTPIHDTPLNAPVLVWREGNTGRSGKWTGPFKLLGIDGETCRVLLPNGPTDFRSTVVRPYHIPEAQDNNNQEPKERNNTSTPQPEEPPHRNLERNRQLPTRLEQNFADISVFLGNCHDTKVLPTYAESRQKEINGLFEKGVFEFIDASKVPEGAQIFGSRFVDEIKHPGIDKAYEKSRLVIQV